MYIHKKTLHVHVHVPVHMALVVSVWLPSGSHLPNPHKNLQKMINKISSTCTCTHYTFTVLPLEASTIYCT